MYTEEERENMRSFVRQMFKDKVSENELHVGDEQLKRLFDEAYAYSEWGL